MIGAGVAGLTATAALHQAGLRVCCVEARDRIGGRILTVRDPLSPVPIELGAEFVHGRAAEIWDLIRGARLTAYETESRMIHVESGKILDEQKIDNPLKRVLAGVQNSANNEKDESFLSFLNRSSYSDREKYWSASYIEGFNAARKEIISLASIAKDARASDHIEGDRTFRILNGYDAVPLTLLNGIRGPKAALQLNSVVQSVQWEPGSASVHVRSAIDNWRGTLRASKVLITVPLGVLQAAPDPDGAIHFDPEPHHIVEAARALSYGQAIRITLRFDHAFWTSNKELAAFGFILSDEPLFPTWWSYLPIEAPILTAWSAGPKADALLGKSKQAIVAEALASLNRISRAQPSRVESAYFHDWHGDPFSRGAYSYVPAGALSARKTLAEPVADTLYFAGEATDLNGYSGTVHGAILSANRAVQQILSIHKPGT